MGDPHSSFPNLPVSGSHSVGKHASIMLFHASPVAHLKQNLTVFSFIWNNRNNIYSEKTKCSVAMKRKVEKSREKSINIYICVIAIK